MYFKRSIAVAFVATGILLIGLQIFTALSGNGDSFEQTGVKEIASGKSLSNSFLSEAALRQSTVSLNESLPDKSCILANGGGRDQAIKINKSESLVPASTMKLLTAAVVLNVLDKDSKLETAIYGKVSSGSAENAYVQTSGDPSFVRSTVPASRRKQYLSPEKVHTFDELAKKIKAEGITNINNLVIDNTWFKLSNVESGWEKDKAQVGMIAALNVDEGFSNDTLALDADSNAGQALKESLIANGVNVNNVIFGVLPITIKSQSNLLGRVSSAKIIDLISEMLKTSNNVYAEQLLAAAVHSKNQTVNTDTRKSFFTSQLKQIVSNTGNFNFVNGSGYSRDIRLSCDLIMRVLGAMNKKGIDLISLSSVAGEDGTLKERFAFVSSIVEAKTGTLDGVTALSGDLGKNMSFSFISNGSFSQPQGHIYQDSVVKVMQDLDDVAVSVK